jgi:hypothetical protein
MSKIWVGTAVVGFGGAVVAGWLWCSPSAGPEPSASAPTAAAARPASSGNIHTAEDFNAWRPSVNLALPDCPQGPTVSPAGPPCVQPHFRKLPPFPDPAENNKTLAGIDADKDGVRDDVQWWIAEQFQADAAMREAYLQAARAQQALFVAPPKTSKDAIEANNGIFFAARCLAAVLRRQEPNSDELDISTEAVSQVESLRQLQIINTVQRRSLHLATERSMHGAIVDLRAFSNKSFEEFCMQSVLERLK